MYNAAICTFTILNPARVLFFKWIHLSRCTQMFLLPEISIWLFLKCYFKCSSLKFYLPYIINEIKHDFILHVSQGIGVSSKFKTQYASVEASIKPMMGGAETAQSLVNRPSFKTPGLKFFVTYSWFCDWILFTKTHTIARLMKILNLLKANMHSYLIVYYHLMMISICYSL